MSRLVIAHVPEEVADVVAAVLRKAARAAIHHEVAAALNHMSEAVITATDVEHDYHVAVGFGGDGEPLRIPADGVIPCAPVFNMLRDAIGGETDVLRLTVVAEGRAKS